MRLDAEKPGPRRGPGFALMPPESSGMSGDTPRLTPTRVSPRARPAAHRQHRAGHAVEHDLAVDSVDEHGLARTELLVEDLLRQAGPQRGAGSRGAAAERRATGRSLRRRAATSQPRSARGRCPSPSAARSTRLHRQVDDELHVVWVSLWNTMTSSIRLMNSGRKPASAPPSRGPASSRRSRPRHGSGETDAGAFRDVTRTEVRGHDDDGVLEVDLVALRVGQVAVFQDLQQEC